MGPRQSNEFSSAFTWLDSLIEDFQHKMESAEPAPHDPSARRSLIVGRSIAHAAVIQLHGSIAQTSVDSNAKCLAAAKKILELAADADLLGSSFIHPIFSVRGFELTLFHLLTIPLFFFLQTIWAAACEVAIDEIIALRAARRAWSSDVPTATECALVALFDSAVIAMRRFGPWPLLSE